MTSHQPTSIQNLSLPEHLNNQPTPINIVIHQISSHQNKVEELPQNTSSDSDHDIKNQSIDLKKNNKKKNKNKNSVPINVLPISGQQPKNIQHTLVSQSQNQGSLKPTVVRHKISEVKKNLFTESSTSVTPLNVIKQDEMKKPHQINRNQKIQELNDKDMKAISSVFGQFFRVQNLKNYRKVKQVNSQVKLQAKPQQQNLTSKTMRVIKTVKPLADSKSSQFFSTTKTIESVDLSSQQKPSLEQIFQQKPPAQAESLSAQKLYTRISSRSASCKKLQEPISEEVTINKKKSRESYQQPQFKLIQPSEPTQFNKQLKSSPLVQKSVDSISFDEELPISPQSFEQFLNNNQFKHPLLQCESRGSFPIEEIKPHSYESDAGNMISFKEVRSIDIEVINNKRKLTNLKINQKNARFCESYEYNSEDVVQTPSFQLKQRDSELEPIKDIRIRDVEEQNPNKKLLKTYSQANPFHPKENFAFSHSRASQTIKESPKQPLYLSKHSEVSIVSHTYSKRLDNFLPMNEQINNIERIFKNFNHENKLMIDVLSYNAGFETVQEVSSNLVNQIEKDQENEYINQLLAKKQLQWRKKLFGVKDQILTPTKLINLSMINQKSIYHINRPSPTKTCSPSKYIYMSNYETEPEYIQTSNKRSESFQITNKQPLRLPTFSHNSFSSHAQLDSEINNDSSSKREELSAINCVESLNNQSQKPAYFSLPNYDKLEQKEQIRAFYDYLQSKQSQYQVKQDQESSEQSNNSLSARNADKLCYRYEMTASNQNKIIPTFQNLHEIKQTSKPILIQNSSRDLSIPQSLEGQQVKKQQKTMFSYINSSAPRNLETLAINFRRQNPVGGHKATNDDIISLTGSIEHEQKTPKLSTNEIIYGSFKMELNSKQTLTETKNDFQIKIPIHSIEPIRVTSKSKSRGKDIIKEPICKQQKVSTVSAKKIKIVSANLTDRDPIQTQLQMPKVFNPPPQINGFLMTPTHLGTMMLNNAFKNYIAPIQVQSLPQKQQKTYSLNQGEQELIKKKVIVNAKPQVSNSKKISINQKAGITSKTLNELRNKTPSQTVQSSSQKVITKINPQLQQTISRINQKSQNELHQMIKSRITERSNSKESNRYQSSTLRKLRDESRMCENDSILSNYQPDSGYSNRKKKSTKNYSNSKEKQQGQIRHTSRSRSSKKSGLQLWNQGLSSLKQSRRENGSSKSPKIFKQKSKRENQKVIGITRWNDNLSKLKQSRSKSRESAHSFGKSSTYRQSNRMQGLNNSLLGLNGAISHASQQMNIEIKKHKYQVDNVQKRYF